MTLLGDISDFLLHPSRSAGSDFSAPASAEGVAEANSQYRSIL
jgi:hypothetical protein